MLRKALLVSLIALLAAGPAGAGTIVVKLGLAAGKLSVKAAPTVVSSSAQIPVTIADGRGTGKGWTLRLAGTGATVTAITARCAANSTCTLPTAVGTPTGGIVLRAAAGTGMGVMNLVVTVRTTAKTAVSFSVA